MPDHLAPQEILTRRLDDLRRVTGLPLVMGGLVRSREHFTISELRGALTTSLHQLRVRQGEGLGGKTLATRRPAAVSAYPRSAAITHARMLLSWSSRHTTTSSPGSTLSAATSPRSRRVCSAATRHARP